MLMRSMVREVICEISIPEISEILGGLIPLGNPPIYRDCQNNVPIACGTNRG
jgi:hypothetical protein